MVTGLQIAGLFLAITAALVFTAWAEAWLASAAAPINKRVPKPKGSIAREQPDRSDQRQAIRAA
ncbi:MAG TPA: hypothetical protein VGB52_03310 [Actinomycetota bacterium]